MNGFIRIGEPKTGTWKRHTVQASAAELAHDPDVLLGRALAKANDLGLKGCRLAAVMVNFQCPVFGTQTVDVMTWVDE